MWQVDWDGKTILVGTSERREETSMDKMGEDVFAKRKRWNGFWGLEAFQHGFIDETGVAFVDELILTVL